MKKILTMMLVISICVGLFAQGAQESSNSNYPTKKVTFVIPYNAGGGTDTLMRLLASAMEKEWGQQVIIANKAGGMGQVGLTELSIASKDGYTIGALSNLDHVLVLKTSENVAYTYDSFEYLGAINTTCNCLYVNDRTGFKSIDDVVAYSKANPGKLTVAISGKTHIAEATLLEKAAGIKVTTVMQNSGNDSLKAVLGGHVDMAIMDKNFVSQVEGKGVTALASFGDVRLSKIPDIATFIELGYPVATETYRVIVVPKGTPKEICEKISTTIRKVSSDPEFQKTMDGMKEIYRYLDSTQVKARLDQDNALVDSIKDALM